MRDGVSFDTLPLGQQMISSSPKETGQRFILQVRETPHLRVWGMCFSVGTCGGYRGLSCWYCCEQDSNATDLIPKDNNAHHLFFRLQCHSFSPVHVCVLLDMFAQVPPGMRSVKFTACAAKKCPSFAQTVEFMEFFFMTASTAHKHTRF